MSSASSRGSALALAANMVVASALGAQPSTTNSGSLSVGTHQQHAPSDIDLRTSQAPTDSSAMRGPNDDSTRLATLAVNRLDKEDIYKVSLATIHFDVFIH